MHVAVFSLFQNIRSGHWNVCIPQYIHPRCRPSALWTCNGCQNSSGSCRGTFLIIEAHTLMTWPHNPFRSHSKMQTLNSKIKWRTNCESVPKFFCRGVFSVSLSLQFCVDRCHSPRHFPSLKIRKNYLIDSEWLYEYWNLNQIAILLPNSLLNGKQCYSLCVVTQKKFTTSVSKHRS